MRNLGFRNLGLRNLGLRNLGFRNLGFRNLGLGTQEVGSSLRKRPPVPQSAAAPSTDAAGGRGGVQGLRFRVLVFMV